MFTLLPNEVVVRVFCFLGSAADVCRLAMASHPFRDMADDPTLWKALYLSLPDIDPGASPETLVQGLALVVPSAHDRHRPRRKNHSKWQVPWPTMAACLSTTARWSTALPDGYGVLVAVGPDNDGRCPCWVVAKECSVPPTKRRRPIRRYTTKTDDGDATGERRIRFEGMWKRGVALRRPLRVHHGS